MANRDVFTALDTAMVGPGAFADNVAGHITTLYNASALRLTSVGGTNDITATVDPVLSAAGLVAGMKFSFLAAATNTDAVTLAINGGSPIAVLDASGLQLPAGTITSGMLVQVEYTGSDYRVTSGAGGANGGSRYAFWQFDESGTWTKPDWLADDALVFTRLWAGGGGGSSASNGCGGGGGAYTEGWFRAGALASSITVTIGAGGAVGATGGTGGNTSFGALLTAYGGAGGSGTLGGGGGGAFAAGAGRIGGRWDGGDGATDTINAADGGQRGGGGGGGPAVTSNRHFGGWSEYGGGGGGGRNTGGIGGTSKFGGNGGNSGVAGAIPSGGGGRNAPGARGRMIIAAG
jgi:hypothetical protein